MNPTKFVLSAADNRIDCGNKTLVMNEVDQYVLEQALVMRKELGGTITAVSVGDLASQDALYVARARGVNRAVRIEARSNNEVSTAEALSEAVFSLKPDLILTGVESSDSMTGQTGIRLAARLGLPFAYAVIAIEARPDAAWIRVRRELGEGVYQVLDIQLPAVLCVQSGIQPLKYTPPARILQARREPLDVIRLRESNSPASTGVPLRFIDIVEPQATKRVQMLSGELEDIAAALVRKVLEAR